MDKQATALMWLSEVLMTLDGFNYCASEDDRQKVAVKLNAAERAAKASLKELSPGELMELHQRIGLFRSCAPGRGEHLSSLVINEVKTR
jgi:hypothetical protein